MSLKENWPRYLYTFLSFCLLPFMLLRLMWRGRKAPAYRERWRERFGTIPFDYAPGTGTQGKDQFIWLHAVSVGETLAAVPLIKEIQRQHPECLLLVTSTTPTGSERVRASFGSSVFHMYMPYDLPCFINRVLKRLNPALLIIMETELWPNLIHCCATRHIPVLLANGRLSERSARGYQRVSLLTTPMLKKLNKIAVQTDIERTRFIALGADDDSVEVTGNIKYDITLAKELKEQAARLKQLLSVQGVRPILLAASTHEGEDTIVLDAFQRLREQHKDLLLMIAPRHPERFRDVAELVKERGYSLSLRSSGEQPGRQQQDVLLCDTMGELLLLYGVCDIAIVGGSFIPVGGHNLMEPAAWGLPILSGQHLFNFLEVSQLLDNAGALDICQCVDDIETVVDGLLNDAALRHKKGGAAKKVIQKNRGALQKLLVLINQQLKKD